MAYEDSVDEKLAEIRDRRWSETEARVVFELLERSGDSISAFARAHDLSSTRLYWWRNRLSTEQERDEDEDELEQLSFAPVVVTGLGLVVRIGELDLEVLDPSGVDPAWLARLLTSLEERR
jgi:transposase-like protein